ncbi:MAG: AsmA-like C-terminal region-containing protein, partial [Limisphaerales bacterium]
DSLLQGHAGRLEIGTGNPDPLIVAAPSFAFHLVSTPDWTRPARLDGTLSTGSMTDSRGRTGPGRIHFDLAAAAPSPELHPPPPETAFWADAWPLTGRLDIDLAGLSSDRLAIDQVHTVLDWKAPRLALREFDAHLHGGRLRVRGDLDVTSRVATLIAESTFDLHGLDPLLGPRSRDNLARYQWAEPPWIEAQARATLPPWGATDVDWDATVKPTLQVDGRVRVGAGSFKGIPFNEAVSSISYDGDTWRLPNLRTVRPEGRQEIAVEYSEGTREYRIDARGRVMPPVLKPVLGEQSAEVVDLFEFHSPVDAEVSVWGPWTEGTRQAILGTITATNFTFRAQRFDHLDARITYTNRFLVAAPVRLTRDAGEAVAEGVGYDFADDRLWLTNAVNTIEPFAAAAAISPSFPAKLAPYRFATPPRIRANGTIRPRDTDSADLTLAIQGGPFEFWRLKAETIETDLLWKGSTLTFTNLSGRFFDGTLAGNAFFDLANPDDGLYRFEARIRQAELGKLLRHASGNRTNVASGEFDLDLQIHSARTSDLHSWNGAGHATLTDGLLWDAPIFGFFSPILNAVVPGLGNNRARAAEASFTIEDSVVHTRDFTIDCPPAKLFYRGQVDFDQRINAKVEAQVLGNFTPMGPLFGLILRPLTKLFEFRITGTLSDVEAEPLYVPKFLLLPLQPLRLLFGLFGRNHGQTLDAQVHSQPEIPIPSEPGSAPTDEPIPPNRLNPPGMEEGPQAVVEDPSPAANAAADGQSEVRKRPAERPEPVP